MSTTKFPTLFLGTPDTAVPSLVALNEVSDVTLVVTRPDRPRGRSGTLRPPPVKEAAREMELAVTQPSNRGELEATIRTAGPIEVGVVVAFGMIIPAPVLAIPARGMINVHFSLLPRWRGASPVQAALMAGDRETGVTLMQMDEGLDTGPVLAAATTAISSTDSSATLSFRMAQLGASLLTSHLPDIASGHVRPTPQDDAWSTYAPKITAANRRLDLDLTPSMAIAKIRALAPRPGALLNIDGQPTRILAARASSLNLPAGRVEVIEGELIVGMSSGSLEILTLHPPGGREMGAADWLRGLRRQPVAAG